MEKKTRFTKWGYEPVVLNSKAKEVFDKIFEKLRVHVKVLKKEVDQVVMRVAYDEYGEIYYELSFVIENNRHEIITSSIYDFDTKIFEFLYEISK